MSYEVLEKTYNTLTEAQQMIVYNLVLSLGQLNKQQNKTKLKKRSFGKFADKAKAVFSDSWEMSEQELCSL